MELDELRRAFDAATPSVEVERGRDAVNRRVRQIRMRRRLTSGVALLVMLAALLGGVVSATRDDGGAKIVLGGGTTVPNGAAVPLVGAPTNVVFVSETRGYGVVSNCTGVQSDPVCEINVGVTNDGGSTWLLAGSIGSVQYRGWSGYPFVKLAASEDHVWVYGNRTYFSRDGGRTWVEQHPGGIVGSLVPVGGSAWGVVRDCAPSVTCESSVWSVPVDGGTWHQLAALTQADYPYMTLRRPTPTVGYVIAQDGSALFRTADGGKTWQRQTVPSDVSAFALRPLGTYELAALGPNQVWVVVGNPNATTELDKALYRSDDGGAHWITVAAKFGLAAQPGQFPERGDVADVAAPTPEHIFVATNPNAASFDGGHTWQLLVGPLAVDSFSFVDAEHGWATSIGAIYRTTDGGVHWKLVHGQPPELHVVTPPTATTSTTATTQPSRPAFALVRGPDGFVVPQGWTGGPVKNFGGPASYAMYRAPNGDGFVDYEVSGGEFAAIYNADHSPTLASALQFARSCTVTRHTSVSASRMTFTCAATNGRIVRGVFQVEPYPQGWKTATVSLPAGSDPAEATAILDSIR